MLKNKCLFSLFLLVFVLSACSGTSATSAKGKISKDTTTLPTNSSKLKPLQAGLVDMGSQVSYQHGQNFPIVNLSELGTDASAFKGIVINETWAQLEPSQRVYDWTDLDQSLSAVKNYNLSHPTNLLSVKLRIFGGKTAPNWAKQLGGSPITLLTTKRSVPGTFGRWWTPQYDLAWSSFQHAMSSRYDSNPLIRAVAVTSCASSTGEPFVVALQGSDIQTLSEAGWTAQAQQNCIQNIFSDYSGWKTTSIDLAANPLLTIVNNKRSSDFSFTDQIISKCISSYAHGGPNCIIGNNDLSDIVTQQNLAAIYSEINNLWNSAPGTFSAYFQTVGPNGQLTCKSINIAISHHADSVELWPPTGFVKGFAAIPLSTLTEWNSALLSGKQLSC